MSKQIRDDFKGEVLRASGLPTDHRFPDWSKWVDKVDESQANGYAFIGAFIQGGTIEVEIGVPRAILVMSRSGSMKYNNAYYGVVVMDAEGNLSITDIKTNDKSKGWALRIRSQVAALVNELASVTIGSGNE